MSLIPLVAELYINSLNIHTYRTLYGKKKKNTKLRKHDPERERATRLPGGFS